MSTKSEAQSSAAAPEAEAAETKEQSSRLSSLFGNAELIIVILLGIVSVATAYASFQAALYDGQTAKGLSQAQSATAEAESLYLEGNQQYVQDGQTLAQLTELQVEINSEDEAISALGQEKFDALYFVAVSEDLDAAIKRAADLDASEPEFYHSPLDDEEYQAVLFGAYAQKTDEALAVAEEADKFDAYGDKLTLNTVLMAISLFLLGVAAVVSARRTQYALIGIGGGIFLLALGLSVTIPFTWI